ncbi:MAG TPA: YncE family protein [Polyangiaceae bacterium]|nr:YncE family protein [Polyangiaceae bacterium]
MNWRSTHRSLVRGVLLSLGFGACGGGGDGAAVDLPYEGVAYPAKLPPIVLPRAPYAFVTDGGADTLTVVDLSARRAVGAVPIGLYALDRDGPRHLAFDPAGGQLFVAMAYPRPPGAPGSHAAHVGGTAFGKVVRLGLPDFEPRGVVSVGQGPGDLVLGRGGSRLVITHFDLETARDPDPDQREAEVYVFDDASGLTEASVPRIVRPCVAPQGVALAGPGAERAWLACYGDDRIVALDLEQPGAPVVVSLDLGPSPAQPGVPRFGPYAATLSPAGDRMLVGTIETERALVEVDLAAATLKTVYRSEGAVFFPAYAPDGGAAFVPTQAPDRVLKIDTATGEVLAERSFTSAECLRPRQAAFVDLLGEPWVLCEGDSRGPGVALALDPVTLETRAAVATGVAPDRFVVVQP